MGHQRDNNEIKADLICSLGLTQHYDPYITLDMHHQTPTVRCER